MLRADRSLLVVVFFLTFLTSRAAEIAITGRALSGSGKPLPGAEVSLQRAVDPATKARLDREGRLPDAIARGKSDAAGYFEIGAPDAGLYTLRIEAPGFVPVEYALAPLLEPIDLPEAALAADVPLTVRTVAPDGKPLAGTTVRISPPRPRFGLEPASWAAAPRIARTGPDGSARVARGDGESYVLTVGAPGFLPDERSNVRGTGVTFRLKPGASRRIEVRSAEGEPVAGALVSAADSGHPLGTTDARGGLVVSVPLAGNARLAISAGDGGTVNGIVSAQAREPEPPRRFVLPRRRSLSGRVIDLDTRRPLAGAWVYNEDAPWEAVPSDAAGSYVLRVPAGPSLRLVAGATGYLRPEALTTRLDSPDAPGPTLALRGAAAVEGLVVDSAGAPIAGAKVRLEPKRPGGGVVMIRVGRESAPIASTSSRGRFRLSSIDPGSGYDLEVRAQGFAAGRREILGLEPRRSVKDVRIELEAGQTLTGRALDAAGEPLRDVVASLRPAPRDGGMLMLGNAQGQEAFTATTDDEGRFAIAGLETGTFDLTLRRKGFARKSLKGIEVKRGPDPVDVGDLVLDPGERVQGQVVDPDGASIEGVEVAIAEGGQPRMMMIGGPGPEPARRPDAVSGPDGWFTLEELGKGETIEMSLSRRGFLTARESGVKVPAPDPLRIVLEPSSRVLGRVVDADRKPIPGAQVSLTRNQTGGIGGSVFRVIRREGAATDDTGRFVFEGVEPGTISLSASSSGFQEAKIDALEVPKGKDLEGIEIPLEPGAIVTGRVLAPDGRPAIGASVGLVREDDEPFRFDGSPTDGDGRYRLEGVQPGRVSVEASHERYVRAVKDLDARPGVNTLNLELGGGSDVEGQVVDAAGAPVPGAWVRLAPAGREWGGPDATSGPDGRFRLTGVGAGDYGVFAGKKGYASATGDVTIHVEGQPVRDVRVEIAKGAVIAGSLVGLAPERFSEAAVRAVREGGAGFAEGSVDRSGRYRVEDLAPGSWTVTASIPSSGEQARGEVSLEVGSPGAELDLQFGRGLTLKGRAVHGEVAVSGATVLAAGTDVDHSGWVRTASDGTFAILGLEPGTYRVDLRQWETGLSYSETVEVKESREIVLDVPSARIAGVVVDASDRQPLAGVTVTASPASAATSDGPSFLTERGATTDLTGRFEIRDLKDGEWRLRGARKGYAARTTAVMVSMGRGDEHLRLELDPTDGLVLEVRLASGRVPEEIAAVVLDPAGRSLTAGTFATGENGRVRLSSVPPGSWEVLVSAGGSATARIEAAAPGGPVAVTLPPACKLRIEVPDLADSNVAATATLKGPDGRPFRALAWFSDPVSEWRMRRGAVELDALPPGAWTVNVLAADGRRWQGSVSTSAGNAAALVLR